MAQEVRRGETVLARCRVVLVCLGTAGRAARMPEEVRGRSPGSGG